MYHADILKLLFKLNLICHRTYLVGILKIADLYQ